jgi:recombination protein RecR
MSKRITGPEIERLIQLLAKVPGLGPRSARRAALHLIKKKEQLLSSACSHAMGDAADKVKICSRCGNVDTARSLHDLHRHPRRDAGTIIVVEDVSDLWALERAGGDERALPCTRRHAIASRRDRTRPAQHSRLVDRVVEGRSTRSSSPSMRLSRVRRPRTTSPTSCRAWTSRITRLAHGVPVGGELDYLDEGTLTAALRARTAI